MKYHELQIKAIERCAGANHMTALLTNEDRSISVSQHIGIDAGQAILASLHDLPNLRVRGTLFEDVVGVSLLLLPPGISECPLLVASIHLPPGLSEFLVPF